MTLPPNAAAPCPGHRTRVRLAGPADHEAIHALNYRTFVEEIPQHPPNPERRLVDRFHADNVYAVCEADGRIVGMVAGRSRRPFSLDQKLGPIDRALPAGCTPVEIRLLAVEPAYRATRVFARLMVCITQHFLQRGCDVGVISGTTRQLPLYRRMGFTPFGPLVGGPDAWFQPMYVTAEQVQAWPAALHAEEPDAQAGHASGGHFLPGPVQVRPAVRAAFAREAVSHRAEGVRHRLHAAQRLLCALTGARYATLLLGSGTLANDVIGAQLRQRGGRGVVCSNGEFGERLVDHATRFELAFDVVRAPWGDALDADVIDRAMHAAHGRWLWAVHTETSTGVVNELDALRTIASRHGAALALDAISSVGGIPVDLTGVWCASTVSGKALAAYAGLAIVLHAELPAPIPTGIPRYLDLGLAAAHDSIPFTQSSNLIDALATSLEDTDWATRLAERTLDGRWLRDALELNGFRVVARRETASPVVHTLALPDDTPAASMGEALRRNGWFVSFESGYLRDRNWLQLCLMGEYDDAALRALPRVLREAAATARRATAPAAAGA